MEQSKKQPAVYTGQLTRVQYEIGERYADELRSWAQEHFRRPMEPLSCHRR